MSVCHHYAYNQFMGQLNLDQLSAEINSFVEERDWDQFHSVKNLSMALSVEASELLEIFQWMPEEVSNHIKNDPRIMAKLQDEVADIFVYLLRIVNKTGMDLEQVTYQKLKKNREKYPVELSKGNCKKYNEL